MNADAPTESTSRSRRAVLAAALGGAAAMVARTVIQPGAARAAGDDGQPILVGSSFLDAQTGTYLSDAANDATVFTAVSSSASGHGVGIGVLGVSGSADGVRGTSDSGTGVRGTSATGFGVGGEGGIWGTSGFSSAGIGVRGASTATDKPGSLGISNGNSTGVQGFSEGLTIPSAKAKTGVYGSANQDATSKGVWGKSAAGHGIHGESSSGWAGYFDGRLLVNKYLELAEISNPSAPGRNHAKLFIRDNGSGKTQLCVRFHTGAVKVLVTQQ